MLTKEQLNDLSVNAIKLLHQTELLVKLNGKTDIYFNDDTIAERDKIIQILIDNDYDVFQNNLLFDCKNIYIVK